jgi:hypothetical protein
VRNALRTRQDLACSGCSALAEQYAQLLARVAALEQQSCRGACDAFDVEAVTGIAMQFGAQIFTATDVARIAAVTPLGDLLDDVAGRHAVGIGSWLRRMARAHVVTNGGASLRFERRGKVGNRWRFAVGDEVTVDRHRRHAR